RWKSSGRGRSRSSLSASIADDVVDVLIVLVADVFLNLFVGRERRNLRHGPGLSERAWIVEREHDFEMPEIQPPQTLRHVQPIRMRIAGEIEPAPILEAD